MCSDGLSACCQQTSTGLYGLARNSNRRQHHRTILLVCTLLALFSMMQSSSAVEHGGSKSHFEYTIAKGFFLQSEEDTNDKEFDFQKQNFGLIDRRYETDQRGDEEHKAQWRRFERYVQHVNEQSRKGEQFKVIFLGRHGQGWHNVAETKYGTAAWDCYWSMLEGADGVTWADAKLTAVGQAQALEVNDLWKSLLPRGIPAPETYYVSPLTRTIETADLSFEGLDLPRDRPYRPIAKELLREVIGIHTCDRRSTASQIHSAFPHVRLEPGFSEKDALWRADFREPRLARRYRLAQLLDDVFAHDGGQFLSFTAHSGAIASLLEALGHRTFALETGGVIPVFVRAELVRGERATPPSEPSEGPPACTSPPAA